MDAIFYNFKYIVFAMDRKNKQTMNNIRLIYTNIECIGMSKNHKSLPAFDVFHLIRYAFLMMKADDILFDH